MTIEKEILDNVLYILSDFRIENENLEICVDYEFSIPRNIDSVEKEHDVVTLIKPKLDKDLIKSLEEILHEEIEIDLEIKDDIKFIRIWTPSGIYRKIECHDYQTERRKFDTEDWIKKYKHLIVQFYEYLDKSEKQRIRVRDFKNSAEHLFRNDYENTIKKLDFLKDKSAKELKPLKIRHDLLQQFLRLIDDGLRDI
ncbi:hypothetical protein [Tenacibaculum piscium]|uniref:hypothetical protein n=1 Tax=Tenacibaculum piscium TaxID=1458515 RepID=UPI001F2E5CFA|nr:hypothetical protein [Tenacibaculum piscium]